MSGEDYREVTVETARRIANLFAKDMVVIVAHDRAFGKVHVTTFGRSPEDKEVAAWAGEKTSEVLGLEVSRAHSHEDFRHRDQAEAKAEIDRLRTRLGLLGDVLKEIQQLAEYDLKNDLVRPGCSTRTIEAVARETLAFLASEGGGP